MAGRWRRACFGCTLAKPTSCASAVCTQVILRLWGECLVTGPWVFSSISSSNKRHEPAVTVAVPMTQGQPSDWNARMKFRGSFDGVYVGRPTASAQPLTTSSGLTPERGPVGQRRTTSAHLLAQTTGCRTLPGKRWGSRPRPRQLRVRCCSKHGDETAIAACPRRCLDLSKTHEPNSSGFGEARNTLLSIPQRPLARRPVNPPNEHSTSLSSCSIASSA